MGLFRVDPQGPAHAYKTYEILSPIDTHTREARCSEVECRATREGWITAVDEATELGQRQAHYIRKLSKRSFTELRGSEGTTLFQFPPGEECFETHRVTIDRDPHYIVKGGDWRGNPTRERMEHGRAEDWVEDFAEHQDGLAERIRQG